MSCILRALRALGLAAAVLVLPCCRDQVGQGDQLAQVTVRASLNLAKIEPTSGCFEPYLSANGRWLVWASTSNVITPNDNNTIRDIFLKDRQTGEIFNLTYVPIIYFTAQVAPADCFDPAVSEDGRYVIFRSKGGWVPFGYPASAMANDGIFRLDRSTGTFQKCWVGFYPDNPLTEPSLSADGQIVAFATAATNLTPPNPDLPAAGVAGNPQIYVHNFNTGVSTIVSRAQSPAPLNTACNGFCYVPRISADGNYVSFVSGSSNLSPLTAALNTNVVYRGTSAGDYVVPCASDALGNVSDQISFHSNISGDGRYVVFLSFDPNLLGPSATGLMRKDLVTGELVLVTDKPAGQPIPAFPTGYDASISGDGRFVAFLGRHDSLSGGIPLNGIAQVFVKDMVTGKIFYCSRHKDGTPSNIDCDPPRLSADGKWVVWSTVGSTLVDGDTNGASDVFLRGPLR